MIHPIKPITAYDILVRGYRIPLKREDPENPGFFGYLFQRVRASHAHSQCLKILDIVFSNEPGKSRPVLESSTTTVTANLDKLGRYDLTLKPFGSNPLSIKPGPRRSYILTNDRGFSCLIKPNHIQSAIAESA